MKFSREASASSAGGAKSCTLASTSAPSAWRETLTASMLVRTASRRASGSAMWTGSGARTAARRLPSSPAPPAAPASRIDTGTSARSSRPSVRIARAVRKRRSAPVDDRQQDVVDGAAEGVLDRA